MQTPQGTLGEGLLADHLEQAGMARRILAQHVALRRIVGFQGHIAEVSHHFSSIAGVSNAGPDPSLAVKSGFFRARAALFRGRMGFDLILPLGR
jgi:hypothetical protein